MKRQNNDSEQSKNNVLNDNSGDPNIQSTYHSPLQLPVVLTSLKQNSFETINNIFKLPPEQTKYLFQNNLIQLFTATHTKYKMFFIQKLLESDYKEFITAHNVGTMLLPLDSICANEFVKNILSKLHNKLDTIVNTNNFGNFLEYSSFVNALFRDHKEFIKSGQNLHGFQTKKSLFQKMVSSYNVADLLRKCKNPAFINELFSLPINEITTIITQNNISYILKLNANNPHLELFEQNLLKHKALGNILNAYNILHVANSVFNVEDLLAKLFQLDSEVLSKIITSDNIANLSATKSDFLKYIFNSDILDKVVDAYTLPIILAANKVETRESIINLVLEHIPNIITKGNIVEIFKACNKSSIDQILLNDDLIEVIAENIVELLTYVVEPDPLIEQIFNLNAKNLNKVITSDNVTSILGIVNNEDTFVMRLLKSEACQSVITQHNVLQILFEDNFDLNEQGVNTMGHMVLTHLNDHCLKVIGNLIADSPDELTKLLCARYDYINFLNFLCLIIENKHNLIIDAAILTQGIKVISQISYDDLKLVKQRPDQSENTTNDQVNNLLMKLFTSYFMLNNDNFTADDLGNVIEALNKYFSKEIHPALHELNSEIIKVLMMSPNHKCLTLKNIENMITVLVNFSHDDDPESIKLILENCDSNLLKQLMTTENVKLYLDEQTVGDCEKRVFIDYFCQQHVFEHVINHDTYEYFLNALIPLLDSDMDSEFSERPLINHLFNLPENKLKDLMTGDRIMKLINIGFRSDEEIAQSEDLDDQELTNLVDKLCNSPLRLSIQHFEKLITAPSTLKVLQQVILKDLEFSKNYLTSVKLEELLTEYDKAPSQYDVIHLLNELDLLSSVINKTNFNIIIKTTQKTPLQFVVISELGKLSQDDFLDIFKDVTLGYLKTHFGDYFEFVEQTFADTFVKFAQGDQKKACIEFLHSNQEFQFLIDKKYPHFTTELINTVYNSDTNPFSDYGMEIKFDDDDDGVGLSGCELENNI